MKKLLFFFLLFFAGLVSAFAQAPTHEQLTYQTVVRNAQNQLVFSQDNITVKVYVCSDAAGTNTAPRGFDINTTDESNCNNVVVNACDLFAVFDSLNTRFNAVYDSLARLAQALEDLINSVPPTANAPTMSDVSSNAMTATSNATSTGAPITSYEFCISTNSDMSGATCQTVPAADADHYTFTGLTGNTNYYVQYKATNVAGTTTPPIVQQRTPAHAPTQNGKQPCGHRCHELVRQQAGPVV